MAHSGSSVNLTPEQVEDLAAKLSALRHNANNHLAMMVAALEVIRTKPEAAKRLVGSLLEQPPKIMEEIRTFSVDLEKMLKVTRRS